MMITYRIFPIDHPSWQSLHNMQFKANHIYNILKPPKLIQIIVLDSKPTTLMYINEILDHAQFMYTLLAS